VRYAFIERHGRIWPICVPCRVLGVSVSGFHQHRARRGRIAPRRHLNDAALLAHIRAVYAVRDYRRKLRLRRATSRSEASPTSRVNAQGDQRASAITASRAKPGTRSWRDITGSATSAL